MQRGKNWRHLGRFFIQKCLSQVPKISNTWWKCRKSAQPFLRRPNDQPPNPDGSDGWKSAWLIAPWSGRSLTLGKRTSFPEKRCQSTIFTSSPVIWVWINTYFNTIFNGMNIHFNPAILMWTTGVQGFDTLPYPITSLHFLGCIFWGEYPRYNPHYLTIHRPKWSLIWVSRLPLFASVPCSSSRLQKTGTSLAVDVAFMATTMVVKPTSWDRTYNCSCMMLYVST